VLSSKEDNTHAANAQSSSVAQTSPVIEIFSVFNQTLPTCLCYFDVYIKAGIICTEKQKPQHEQAQDARAVLSFKWQSKSGEFFFLDQQPLGQSISCQKNIACMMM